VRPAHAAAAGTESGSPRPASRPAAPAAPGPAVDPARGKKALSRGLQALGSGEYIRAVQELETASQASPRDHEALRALSEAEFELARYGRALTHARKAVSLAPREARYRLLVGDNYFKLRRYREAAEAYGAAANLSPGDASIRARQQLARDKIGSSDEAVGAGE
jgi:tetratricopeptide (TPR) repeat protein